MAKRRRARRGPSPAEGSKKRRNMIMAGAAVLGLVVLGVLLAFSLQDPPVLEGLDNQGRPPGNEHDANFEYEFGGLPPVGGVHNPNWQNCGIYAEPVRPELAVHSLEHGAVWITYDPDLPADDVEYLKGFARGKSHMLMSPYPEQDSPVVLTAWGLQLALDSVPDERVQTFVQRYHRGPQTPEPGATCSGGVGEPTG